MNDVVIMLVLFIICSGIKSIYFYTLAGLDYHMMSLHVITSMGFSVLVILFTLKLRNRFWFGAWYFLQALALFINSNYFEFFGKLLHLNDSYIFIPHVLMLARNLAIPLDAGDLLFVVDLPLFFYLLAKRRKGEIAFKNFGIIIKFAAGITTIASIILLIVPAQEKSKPYAHLDDYETIARFGVIGHHIIDMLQTSANNDFEKITYGPIETGQEKNSRKPNFVLLQIESLDANVVNYKYNGTYVTPFFHSLTTKSLYFPYTLCYRKMGGTSDCEIAVNNSIEPSLDFAIMMKDQYSYPNSMVKVLKRNGYHSEAFHGNTGWFWNRLSAYTAMGYNNFSDPNTMKQPVHGWGVSDHNVLKYVEGRINKPKEPFLVSVITMTSHTPFNYFEHFQPDKRFANAKPDLTKNYFASIAYTDQVVGEFVSKILSSCPDTYIFIYGDHTPYDINDGAFRRSVLHKSEAMEMVPLFIITPNGQKHYERSAVASYLDIALTILHAAGVPFNYRSFGVNLLDKYSLQHSVVYRGQQYSRTELFKSMLDEYGKPWQDD